MSQNIAEIIHPVVEKGLLDNEESAFKNLPQDYIIR